MGMGKQQRSRPHKKNHHLKDTTNLPRSSNTLVEDKPAGGPAIEISRGKQRSCPHNHMKNHLPGSSNTVVKDKPSGGPAIEISRGKQRSRKDKPAGGPAIEISRGKQRSRPDNRMKNHLPGSSNTVDKDKPAGGPAIEISRGKQRSRPKNQKKNHLPGNNNTVVKDKRAGGPTIVIPRALYNCIQAERASRKEWEAKRDEASKLKLEKNEELVGRFVLYYTFLVPVLPCGWRYNLPAACTFVPSDEHPSPMPCSSEFPSEEMTNTSEDEDDPYPDDDNRYDCKLPEISEVPLKEDETKSWLQFKKLYEGNPTPVPSVLIGKNFPHNINIEHPFVSVIGSFAFNGFNELYEMFVEKGEHNVLSDPAFRECTYVRSNGSYWFKMTIEAVENGFCCIYQAIVKCTEDNGERTLLEFSLTEVKGKKEVRASKSESSKGKKEVRASKSESSKDKKGVHASKSKSSKGVFFRFEAGMHHRDQGGYDYADPTSYGLIGSGDMD